MAEELLDELPRPQRLALSYAPAKARRATLALLALDARLAAVLRRRGEPMLAQMRLAWWRDRLADDPASWPVDAVLALLRQWREPGALVPLVDGWEALLGEQLDQAAIAEFARGRGAGFGSLARELHCDTHNAEAAGRLWARGDLAANLTDPAERAAAIEAAGAEPRVSSLPRLLRPLTVLAGLAEASLRRGGAPLLANPGAALLAVRLGIFGR
jgi:phytoene synthase